MKKNRVLIVLLFLLFSNAAILGARKPVKIKSIVLEVTPEFNMLFFSDDAIGGDFFYSTQLRASLGISWKKNEFFFSMGVDFLMPHQFFHENNLDFYSLGIFLWGEKPLTDKISFLLKFRAGIYNFRDQDDPISPYVALGTGLGYYLTDDLMLTLEIDVPVRTEGSATHLDGSFKGPVKMNILTFSLGVRYYFDLSN